MNKFFQVYCTSAIPGSGGMFPVSDERFATRQEAEVKVATIYAQEKIHLGSGVYLVSDLTFWAQQMGERDGRIFIEFT